MTVRPQRWRQAQVRQLYLPPLPISALPWGRDQVLHLRSLPPLTTAPSPTPNHDPTNHPLPRAAQTRAKCKPGSPPEMNRQIGVEADTGRMFWGWSGALGNRASVQPEILRMQAP